jgi:pantoate--beta-alanine ligase
VSRVVATVEELRDELGGVAPGLVPTMGALHEGHLALIRRAAAENARTVVSVFVNPTQFDDPADLGRYPRNLAADAALAAGAGADVVFAPAPETVYPVGFATAVEVAGLTEPWEGAARPGHFRGVATVVAILLNAVRPARAYFGEKDFQQLVVVRRLHRDLRLPGEIVGCPTVRDADGLALSSRNARLTPAERERALAVPRALFRMAELAHAGEPAAASLLAAGRAELSAVSAVEVQYLAVVDPESLEPVDRVGPGARALIAVRVGDVRLIDNVELMPGPLTPQPPSPRPPKGRGRRPSGQSPEESSDGG